MTYNYSDPIDFLLWYLRWRHLASNRNPSIFILSFLFYLKRSNNRKIPPKGSKSCMINCPFLVSFIESSLHKWLPLSTPFFSFPFYFWFNLFKCLFPSKPKKSIPPPPPLPPRKKKKLILLAKLVNLLGLGSWK